MAIYRHLSDAEVRRQPLSWLFEQEHQIRWARWRDTVHRIVAAEVGTARAIMAAMGHDPEPLPGFDEIEDRERAAATADQIHIPDWMVEFERVNVGRVIQTSKRSASSPE